MNILFFGSSDYSYACLNAVLEEHHVVGIVTQPDKLNQRKKYEETYLKQKMKGKYIPIYQPYNIKEEYELIKEINPDLILTAAYGQILSQRILDIPKYGSVNIHASYLPYYKGASPIRQVIIDGQEYTGITSIYMDEDVDTGRIIIQEKIPLAERETFGSLYKKFLDIIPEFTIKTIDSVLSGNKGTEQEYIKNSYTRKNTNNDLLIDWQNECLDIDRQIRAFSPDCGCKCFIAGKEFKIFEAKPLDIYHNNDAGLLIRVDKDFIRISCGKGYIDIYKIQIPGKKIITATDFINGNRQWLKSSISIQKYA